MMEAKQETSSSGSVVEQQDEDQQQQQQQQKQKQKQQQIVEIDLEALQCNNRSDGEREETLTPLRLRWNRAFMTVLHFVLTYPRWSISLFLLFANWTTPLPTPNERVREPVRHLQAIVQQEAQLYSECIVTGFAHQNDQLDRAAAIEHDRVQQQQQAAQDMLQQAAQLVQQCAIATRASQRGMQAWDALGLIVPKTFNRTTNSDTALCTADDQERLYALLTEDLTALQENVTGILDSFIAKTLKSLEKIMQYSQDRGIYDYNYFVGVKIQATLAALDGLEAPNITLSFPQQELVLELRNILGDLTLTLNDAYMRIGFLSTRLYEFHTSINAFYVNYVGLYNRFALIDAWMHQTFPDLINLPDFFEISAVPNVDLLLPRIPQIPTFADLPDIEDLVSEYIAKALKLIARLLVEAAKEASYQTRKAIEEILERLKELLTLEDYHPPKYPREGSGSSSPEEELAYLNELAEQTKTDAGEALDGIKKQRDSVPDYDQTPPDLDDIDTPDLQEEPKEFSFLDLDIPAIVLPVWFVTTFGYLCSRTFIFECVTQAIRLYRLKQKYETNGMPDLPEINYLVGTEYDDSDKEKEKESKPSKLEVAQQMILKQLFNPWVISGFVLIPFILVVLFGWFPHVKATCVDSRRGTFLARNLFTQIQVNNANTKGYALHTAAQLKCQRRKRSICNRKYSESNAIYRKDVATLFALQSRFNESLSGRGVLDRCVDTKELDYQFETNCCGLEGYATETGCSPDQRPEFCPIDLNASPHQSFLPVGATLFEPACQANMSAWRIEKTLFNCSVLEESCDEVPCSGVDADLIEQMTIDADCSAEIYAIQAFIFLCLIVFHAIMINVCNSLFFNGILCLRWRSLNPEGIKMMTHVTDDGELVKGGDIQERTERIEKAMQRFKLSGWIQIVLSFVALLVWMIVFCILKKALSLIHMYHE